MTTPFADDGEAALFLFDPDLSPTDEDDLSAVLLFDAFAAAEEDDDVIAAALPMRCWRSLEMNVKRGDVLC